MRTLTRDEYDLLAELAPPVPDDPEDMAEGTPDQVAVCERLEQRRLVRAVEVTCSDGWVWRVWEITTLGRLALRVSLPVLEAL